MPARRNLCLFLVLGFMAAPPAALAAEETATVQSFGAEGEGTPFVLSRHGADPGPEVERGSLVLLNGMRSRGRLRNSVAFARTAEGIHRRVRATVTFRLSKGAHGGAFALLDTARHGIEGPAPEVEAWEEPNIAGSLAVGLDVFNPPTRHWFDEHGHVHDQPQREVSVHVDGRELAGALSPVEFRDGRPHRLDVGVRFSAGGAYVTVRIDRKPVFDERFFPGITPYESRVALGGRTGGMAANLMIDDVRVEYEGPAEADAISPEPVRVRTFDAAQITSGRQTVEETFRLPAAGEAFQRVILSLTLGPGEKGWDEWDRNAAVYAWDDEGQRVEILRWITPFAREYTWRVDVTDYQSILRGERKMASYISSYKGGNGFSVTIDLDYYPGVPEREAFRVVNLWNLNYTFGNEEERIAEAFPERRVERAPLLARVARATAGRLSVPRRASRAAIAGFEARFTT